MSDATVIETSPAPRNGNAIPVATGPGTDFMAVAIGTGANIEALPTYFADPLLQTGNMPGIAISAFNNRALRQGTFVASSLCQWISNETNKYIPDDGDQINWIVEWQNALTAFVEQVIPPAPNLGNYLPLTGGQMLGNITFQLGITTVLANNTWYRGLDTNGQSRGLIVKDANNNVTVNDGSSQYVVIGGIPVANNNFSWSGRNTSGTTLPVIGLLSDNNIHIGSVATTDIYFDETAAVHHAGNFILNNNRFVEAVDTGGTARQLLGLTTANTLAVGGGVTGELDIYGNPIWLRATAYAAGVFQVNGYCYLQGGARSYIPGGNDPHTIYADNGYYARHHYIVAGTRNWSCGCVSGGNFVIADESAAAVRWQIDTGGNITSYNSQTVNGNLTVGGNFQCNNSINASANLSCSNTLFVYNQAQVWNSVIVQTGALYVQNGGISAAGQISSNSNVVAGGTVFTNYITTNGGQYISSQNGMWFGGGPGWSLYCAGVSYFEGQVNVQGGNQIALSGSGGYTWGINVLGGSYWNLGDLSSGLCVIECIPGNAKTWLEGTSACNGDWLVMGSIYGNLCEARFKNDIQPFTCGLTEICALNPVSFYYNQDPLYPPMKNHLPSSRQIAVMADEVAEVFPEMLSEEQDITAPAHEPAEGQPPNRGRLLHVNALQYAMVNAIKELAARLAVLEGRA